MLNLKTNLYQDQTTTPQTPLRELYFLNDNFGLQRKSKTSDLRLKKNLALGEGFYSNSLNFDDHGLSAYTTPLKDLDTTALTNALFNLDDSYETF